MGDFDMVIGASTTYFSLGQPWLQYRDLLTIIETSRCPLDRIISCVSVELRLFIFSES